MKKLMSIVACVIWIFGFIGSLSFNTLGIVYVIAGIFSTFISGLLFFSISRILDDIENNTKSINEIKDILNVVVASNSKSNDEIKNTLKDIKKLINNV